MPEWVQKLISESARSVPAAVMLGALALYSMRMLDGANARHELRFAEAAAVHVVQMDQMSQRFHAALDRQQATYAEGREQAQALSRNMVELSTRIQALNAQLSRRDG